MQNIAARRKNSPCGTWCYSHVRITVIRICSSHVDLRPEWQNNCIARNALPLVIHHIQSENLFGSPVWYIKWLGTIDLLYPAWCMDLRIPPPSLFCGIPPPIEWNMNMSMVVTISLVCLPVFAGWSIHTWEHGFFSFDFFSDCSAKQFSGQFSLVWIALTFLNKCSLKTFIMVIICHLSSPLINIKDFHHFVNAEVIPLLYLDKSE